MGIAIEYGPDEEYNTTLLTHPATHLAFHNHPNRSAMIKQLITDDGAFRTYYQWVKLVKPIVSDYDKNLLKLEHQTATACAQMAMKWRNFQRRKTTYPNLKYITQADDCVRLSHRPLHHIVRPVDDQFWDIFFPPNGWGCRCDVQQTDDPVTESIEGLEVPGIWCFNVGNKNVQTTIESLGVI